MRTNMTCIYCPIGCTLEVEVDNGEVRVKGNRCPRGCDYARQELLEPKRVLFTVLRVDTEDYRVAAVRSTEPVPKDRMSEILRELSRVRVPPDARVGDRVAVIQGHEFILTRK